MHHVMFQACGGGNQEDNLVPLCPTCHQGIHRKLIEISSTDLLDVWAAWKALRVAVPTSIAIGHGDPALIVKMEMGLYGLNADISVSAHVPYAEFRKHLLDSTVEVVKQRDRHCPFRPESTWRLSSDEFATVGKWHAEPATMALAALEGRPIFFTVNMPIAMSRRPPRIALPSGWNGQL